MRRTLLHDSVINELAFDALFTLSADKKSLLNSKELLAIKSAKRARYYCTTTTLDEKILMFAKLGIPVALTFMATGQRDLKELQKKYQDLSKGQKASEAAKIKFVVLTDRIAINFLNVMAHTTHSDAYLLNLDYHRVGVFLHNWKDYNATDSEKMPQFLEFAKIVNRYTHQVALSLKSLKGEDDITGDLDLNMLMYLLNNQNGYVSRGTIDAYLGGLYKKTLITASIHRLCDKRLIEKNPTIRKPEYQITSQGNLAIMNFHKKNLAASV